MSVSNRTTSTQGTADRAKFCTSRLTIPNTRIRVIFAGSELSLHLIVSTYIDGKIFSATNVVVIGEVGAAAAGALLTDTVLFTW